MQRRPSPGRLHRHAGRTAAAVDAIL